MKFAPGLADANNKKRLHAFLGASIQDACTALEATDKPVAIFYRKNQETRRSFRTIHLDERIFSMNSFASPQRAMLLFVRSVFNETISNGMSRKLLVRTRNARSAKGFPFGGSAMEPATYEIKRMP